MIVHTDPAQIHLLLDTINQESYGNLYIMRGDTNAQYQSLTRVQTDWQDTLFWFKGEAHAATWTPLRVTYHEPDQALPRSDSPYLDPRFQILTQHAVDALEELVRPFGELLPLQVDVGPPLFLYNVTMVLPVFDEANSVVTHGRRTGIITSFKQYAFHRDRIGDVAVFKIAENNQTAIFVTDVVVRAVKQAQLTGVEGMMAHLTLPSSMLQRNNPYIIVD